MTSESQQAQPGKHVPALDGVRGLAILWVVPYNALEVLSAPPAGPIHLFAMLAHPGWVGVQLFFALSGFLITGGLLDTRQSKNYFRAFYARRALRILPLYYIVLLGLLLLTAFIAPPGELHSRLRNQIWLWTFLSNWTKPLGLDLEGFGHFWSLAVEEQFYLLWPFAVYRLDARRLFHACLWISLGALLVRCAMAASGVSPEAIYSFTVCRMDALALGAAGAALLRIPGWPSMARARLIPAGWIAVALFLAGAVLTRGYATGTLACETLGYTILAFSSAVLVTGVALARSSRPGPLVAVLQSAPLRSLGRYSYAMYVLHFPIHELIGVPLLRSMMPLGIPPGLALVYGIGMIPVSYVLAILSYHTLEKHFLKLKSRFLPAAKTLPAWPAGAAP
jgi:peptidoglycan/LPS O-acetylase OafA/YrhL